MSSEKDPVLSEQSEQPEGIQSSTGEPELAISQVEPITVPSQQLSAPSENNTIKQTESVQSPIELEQDLPQSTAVEDESEGEDYTKLSASDDPEKARNYKEYKRLVKDIKHQNDIVQRIKDQINSMNCKPCLTPCEKQELKKENCYLKQELKKLQCLIKNAARLQNFGSHRRYKEINLITTLDDEQGMVSLPQTCKAMQMQTKALPRIYQKSSRDDNTASSDLNKSCSRHYSEYTCECKESQLMEQLYAALQTCKNSNSQNNQHYNKKCQATKNDPTEKLKQRLNVMQETLTNLNEKICKRHVDREPKMSRSFQQSNHKARPTCPETAPTSCETTSNYVKYQELEDKYLYLLTEYGKREADLKEITNKLKSSCGSGHSASDSSEIHLLTSRINDLKEEQIEFKCLMKEQSVQLEDYRNKYLTAQQTVEEQCVLIEKLNMNNKRIEKQINMEIKEIRKKFQEKLNDLLQYPKLLENEQIKVVKLCKEKEDLKSKLVIVCRELKTHTNKSTIEHSGDDYKSQLQKCQDELEKTKTNLNEMQRQRDSFCQQLKASQEDLDCLRSESVNIISRTKERSELIRQNQKQLIDRLEKQLAQCRASASLSVGDRECVIREMQGQLNNMSFSFDAAQKQIKTLRNHITYMSNENCLPSKC